MALELGRAGFKVVVLEKGAHYQPKDFVHDEILNSRRNFFMPLPWDEPHLLRSGDKAPFARTNEGWTANCVGGGTVHMSGYFYRLKPIDFRLKTELGGSIKNSNIADWPISYADLAPFYDQVEAELGVSGNAVPHPFLEPRKGNYPLGPLETHPIGKELDRVIKALGWHSLPTARRVSAMVGTSSTVIRRTAQDGSSRCRTARAASARTVEAGSDAGEPSNSRLNTTFPTRVVVSQLPGGVTHTMNDSSPRDGSTIAVPACRRRNAYSSSASETRAGSPGSIATSTVSLPPVPAHGQR